MRKDTLQSFNTIVKGQITRKPSGDPLSLRVLFGPDNVTIPKGKEVTYQVQQEENGTITLTPEGVA